MTTELDLGIGRKPSPLEAHPLENRPRLLQRGVQEFTGGAPKHEKPRSIKQATTRLGELIEPEVSSGNVLVTHPGFSAYLSAAVIQLDSLVPSRRWNQASEVVKQVKLGMMNEFLAASKDVGNDREVFSRVQSQYRLAAEVLSDLEVLVDKLIEPVVKKGVREVKTGKDSLKVTEGAEKKVEEKNGEKITVENWRLFARRLLNSDGPPVAGYGVYGQMDEVAEGITVRLEALARSLEEKGRDLEVARQIKATIHLRHCAYAFKGLLPIKLIKDRLEKFVLLDASKSRFLTGEDLELLHKEGISGLEINKALDLLRRQYISGALSSKGITEIDKQRIYGEIYRDLGLREEDCRLSLDYALNIGWATGLIAEWDMASRRATNLSKLFFFGDYRTGESDVSDGGLIETKSLVLYLPPGSFYRGARTSKPLGDFIDAEGTNVVGKNSFLVDPKPDKPTMYDPYFYATVSTVDTAQTFALRRHTGWWKPSDGMYGNMTYKPIDYDKLEYTSLPVGSYEAWVKNVRRASTVAGYLLTSYWTPGDLTSDKLAEMHSLISELDPSRSCRLQMAIATTVLVSINKEGLEAGAWKTTEVSKFLGNCLKPIGQKGGTDQTLTAVSFLTQQELQASMVTASVIDQRTDLISVLVKRVPPGSLRTILDAAARSFAQKVGGRFATTGR